MPSTEIWDALLPRQCLRSVQSRLKTRAMEISSGVGKMMSKVRAQARRTSNRALTSTTVITVDRWMGSLESTPAITQGRNPTIKYPQKSVYRKILGCESYNGKKVRRLVRWRRILRPSRRVRWNSSNYWMRRLRRVVKY